MKKRILFFILFSGICSMLMWQACSEDEIIMNLNAGESGSKQDTTGSSSGTQESRISFFAMVESLKSTKTISALQKGRYVVVYAFEQGNSVQSPFAAKNDYITKVQGTLTPIGGSYMSLVNDTYNFYAVSTNSNTNQTPDFEQGIASSLLNGIDYLWWGQNDYLIDNSIESIHIVLNHSCTQIVIKVQAGSGIVIDSIESASITPSETTGSTMNLSNGIITPAKAISSTYINMGVNKNVCQLTMLPLQTTHKIFVKFTIRVNNETAPRNYLVEVPVPNSTLLAGNSYLFEAIIEGDTITFPSVSVIEWVTVDETGIPLYPSEV